MGLRRKVPVEIPKILFGIAGKHNNSVTGRC
jgi:hypothetical protein